MSAATRSPIVSLPSGEDICGDGSIMKWVITAAPADAEKPEWGHKVEVHYVGTLTQGGTRFDSSRDRGAPFDFTVGAGVIQGWSEAVPTMRVGETAKFTICPAKAYGAQGSPPNIPPDAHLDFEIELLSTTDREDVCHDGSILKKILHKNAVDWQTPNHNCDLNLKIGDAPVTWLSAEGTEPPAGLPLKLRDGIHEMKKGEQSSFLLPKERPGEEFVVELVSWVENEDCSFDEPGCVIKRVERPHVKHDKDWKTPADEDTVEVRGRAWAAGDASSEVVYGDIDAKADPATWQVDEEIETRGAAPVPVCRGLEAAIKRMKVGEVATVKVKASWGFESGPLQGKDLEARLELVKIEEVTPAWELKNEKKIDSVNQRRSMGNCHVARADFARAIRRYSSAIEAGASDYDVDGDELKAKLHQAVAACKLNRAMCHLRLDHFSEAEKDCKEVLENDPANLKALFRLGKARLAADQWDGAKQAFKKVLELDAQNMDARRGLRDILRREKEQKQVEKALYAGKKLFSKKADPRSLEPKAPKEGLSPEEQAVIDAHTEAPPPPPEAEAPPAPPGAPEEKAAEPADCSKEAC